MSYHKQNHTCSACGYPAAKLRKCMIWLIIYRWMVIEDTTKEGNGNRQNEIYEIHTQNLQKSNQKFAAKMIQANYLNLSIYQSSIVRRQSMSTFWTFVLFGFFGKFYWEVCVRFFLLIICSSGLDNNNPINCQVW